MYQRVFESWTQLTELGYFECLPDGRLGLAVDGVDGIVDFHTHLGWTMLLAPPVDLTRQTPRTEHNFGRDLRVYLDIYSGQNIFEERRSWGWTDYVPCSLSPVRFGRHVTHTFPNLLREMDPLKIETSVILCLDLSRMSNNSERAAGILADQPRLVFYCSVHPADARAEQKMESYLAAGAEGLKVHPEMSRTPVDSRTMLEFLNVWNRLSGGLPVLFHTGYNGFEPKRARECASIERFEPAIEALGETPCILGHAAMTKFRAALDFAERHSHVYLEIGGQPPSHIREMLDRIGDDRILFGSDWPVYPQALPLAKLLLATEDAPSARLNILRENARRLLEEASRMRQP